MYITFEYCGDVSHLTRRERTTLARDLDECLIKGTWEVFDINSRSLTLNGGYDDEDGYCNDHEDIEYVLGKYEIDWSGRAKESPCEPDWDKMPGGYDDCLA